MPATVIHVGDCRATMQALDADSVDAICTDPPYELGFMGKAWDASGIAYDPEVWQAALRVLKPGGHLLAFGGARTYHRLAVAIEDAGFEIRDCIQWLYGSGFPKSLDVSKAIDKAAGAVREVVGQRDRYRDGVTRENRGDRNEVYGSGLTANGVAAITAPATDEAAEWQGWGTALKPACEPIVVARKPFRGTVAQNVLTHGTGAINIDGCRIDATHAPVTSAGGTEMGYHGGTAADGSFATTAHAGRWPANVILDDEAAKQLDEQSGACRSAGMYAKGSQPQGSKAGAASIPIDGVTSASYADKGGASRFFYVAKASKRERNAGLDHLPAVECTSGPSGHADNGLRDGERPVTMRANHHPTVKPVNLMRYLVRLVTPPGGIVLDPFMGSGTTGIAALLEGFDFVGCELDSEYANIARARIAHHAAQPEQLSL